jgi:DNA-3-methyladenine glycosylase II
MTRMLGLRTNLVPFYRIAGNDPALGPLAENFLGLKPPRLPSVFETLINAISCQQLTLTVGLILLNRLARKCRSKAPTAAAFLPFPSPGDVLRLTPGQLRALGFSRQKSGAIRAIATSIKEGELDPEALNGLGDEEALAALCRLRGIGRWSAEYVLLRGLGRLCIFPGDDVGARNNLERWLMLRRPLDYKGVGRRLRRWQPYAGLVYFHLLVRQLADRGYVR